MKTELKSKENNKVVVEVSIDNKEFDEAINKVYQENKGYFEVQGFRKGKAPRKLIELNYGKTVFYEDAFNNLLNEKYPDLLKEYDLDPIDYPEINMVDELSLEKPFTVEFTIPVMPVAKLKPGYKDAESDLVELETSEEDLNAAIEKEREKNARLVEVDRPAEEGDTLNIDFEGFVDGEAFEGGKGENYNLELGSHTFIPGFEEGLVGAEKGDEKDLEVTFPENYQEELKGKDAVFKVKVNNIKEKELPELDDDFAMDISEFDSFDEYKEDLKKQLEKNVETSNKNEKYNRSVMALTEYLDVEIPDALVNHQIDHELKDFERRILQMGLDLEGYYRMANTNEAVVRDQLEPQALARLKSDFTLQALADAENIEASEEEVDQELKDLAKAYGKKEEEIDEFIKNYKESEDLASIKDLIKNRKALDKAVDLVSFNIVDEYESPEEEDTADQEDKDEE